MNKFPEKHALNDRAYPSAEILFAPTQDAYGTRLALVFGNESRDGSCPFYGHGCFHCDIGAGEGAFSPQDNARRLEFYRQAYGPVLPRLKHLVFYNSGSLLNPHELSDQTLNTLVAFARELPECTIISMDSREMFVAESTLGRIRSALRTDQQLRITFGLETQDDHARCEVLAKTMTRQGIERAFNVIGRFQPGVGAEINLVFQSPGIEQNAAIDEAGKTFQYGLELSQKFSVPVDFNFHPYYPSRVGWQHFPNHPRSRMADAIQAITLGRQLIDQAQSPAKIFIGWHDEGHDQEEATREQEGNEYLNRFQAFNCSQDPKSLAVPAIATTHAI
jgi:hypothetical protein